MVENLNQVRISAPCRIHLGLLSVQENDGRQFGGAGVMLDQPSLELTVKLADEDSCRGPLARRALAFIDSWRKSSGIGSPVCLQIQSAPPEHVGLGLGTQLGMSVAMALDSLFDRQAVSVSDRARSVGRGLRSAVGAHGFHRGGLIVESGKYGDEKLGKLEAQVTLPSEWRVMLVRMRDEQGLAGDAEVAAFQALTETDTTAQSRLLKETLFNGILPAAEQGNFEQFAESVYRYGYAAGQIFADRQGGPFLNSAIAEFVEHCRSQGVLGVGQSSWGPTVFCWFSSESAAMSFKEEHVLCRPNLEADVVVTAVSARGADVTFG